MNDILDIIYNASQKRLLLDDVYINKIIEILKINNNLYNLDFILNYKKGILFLNSTLGTYYNNKINLYLNKIIKYINYNYNKTNFKLESKLSLFENYLKNNLFILKIIYHEIEHYYQDYIYQNNKDNTLQNKLIILEEQAIKENRNSIEFYKKLETNYDISFIERMADTKAYKNILFLIKEIKNEILNLHFLQELILLDRQFEGYNKDECPTINYFINLNQLDKLADILKNYKPNDLSFDYRLNMGLPIDEYEYETIKTYLKSKKINN